MPDLNLTSQAKEFAERIATEAEKFGSTFGSFKEFIAENFGENGMLVVYLVVAVITILLFTKLAKTAIGTVKYLAIPAVGLALLAVYFTGQSFYVMLPVTVTGCALILLFKG